MITKHQIKDWLEVDKRRKVLVELEKHIDGELKENLLLGKTTIIVSTKKYVEAFQDHESTEFNDLWHSPELSADGKREVQRVILKKYRDNGFNVVVEKANLAHRKEQYDYLKFIDIHKMIEDEE